MSSQEKVEYERVTHCVFDLDGTLIDSEKFLSDAINDVVHAYGKRFTWSLKSKTVGLHLALSGPIIIEELSLPLTTDEYVRDVLKRFEMRISDGCHFMAGAVQLVKHLAKHSVPLAICTGSTRFTYSLKVKHFGDFFDVGNYWHHIVKAGDDPLVKRHKPYPEPYIVCIDQFDPPPNPKHVLVFEDSPTGVTSAMSAGCQCVMIPDSRFDKRKLQIKPTLVIDSLNDFQPQLFGLPKF